MASSPIRAREDNKGNRVSVAPSEGNMQKSAKMVTWGFQRSIWWDKKELGIQQLNALWVKTHMFKSCIVFVHVSRAEKDRDAEKSPVGATQYQIGRVCKDRRTREREIQPHSQIPVKVSNWGKTGRMKTGSRMWICWCTRASGWLDFNLCFVYCSQNTPWAG